MVTTKLCTEGGGNKALNRECRRGVGKFIEKAGAARKMPQIVACGSRENAYERFKTVLATGYAAILLVDAEEPVAAAGPWEHLKTSDGWDRPSGATDEQCHLMVQVMESWFLADVDALASFYGQGFQSGVLSSNPNIEQIPKEDVLNRLVQATHNTKKGSYNKGMHSFEIMEKLDPAKVRTASNHADRFMKALSV